MPQPKSSSSSSKPAAKKAAAKSKPAAKSRSAAAKPAAAKRSAPAKPAAAKRTTAAKAPPAAEDAVRANLALDRGDLIVAIEVPASPEGCASHYLKVRDRESYEFALVSASSNKPIIGIDSHISTLSILRL